MGLSDAELRALSVEKEIRLGDVNSLRITAGMGRLGGGV